jgi:hypothetical protein
VAEKFTLRTALEDWKEMAAAVRKDKSELAQALLFGLIRKL